MTKKNTKTFMDTRINANWFLTVKIVSDRTVEILSHYRMHVHAEGQPKSSGEYRTVETDDRTVTGVELEGDLYSVINPRNVFDYGPTEKRSA